MKRKKSIAAGFAVLMLLAGVALAADGPGWLDDFEKAKKLAEEKNVPILAYFSGSDWCGWCKRLDSEVLSKDVFKEFASKNFVLFLADFPSRKKLDEGTAKQNDALQKRYNVQGFPTLLVLKSDGSVVAQTGYRRGGPDKYVEHLKEVGL